MLERRPVLLSHHSLRLPLRAVVDDAHARLRLACMDCLVVAPTHLLGLDHRPGSTAPALPPRRLNARRNLAPVRNASLPLPPDSARKFAIGGFLPLPSISASPICTPTSSSSPLDDPSARDSDEYTTAPSSPASCHSNPPTWISIPPTPPPNMVKRSVTCFPRPVSRVSPSVSFPVTTLTQQEDYFMKRSLSVPEMPHCPPLSASAKVASSDASETSAPSLRPSLSRSKPLFHSTDDSPRLIGNSERFPGDTSAEGSWSEPEDLRQSDKAKDNVRRYHALKELLDTELGYLLDLRALVYLRIIPTLVCRPAPSTTFGRASQSFASSPWVNSHSYAAAAAATSASASAVSESCAVSSLNASQSKDLQKSTTRYLFTSLEVEMLTRNAEEVLQLHEQFMRELRKEIIPLGFHLEAYKRSDDPAKTVALAMQNTDAAIRIISTKFATEASRFASYQTFCAGHSEALDLVRKVVAQRPVEWEAFEQRCSSLVKELELCTTPESQATSTSGDHETSRPAKDRSRAASMSSLEGAVRTLRSRASIHGHGRESVMPLAESAAGRKEKTTPRLAFLDYMIKPVQRICKYPLIIDQLKSGKSVRTSSTSDVDVVVESAQQAMKHVASAVDEARHRQDGAMRSALIASRMTLGSSAMSSLYPTFKALSQPFLSSLGTCLLAGSLDVIHHSAKTSASSLVVKYLGAFLYLGGYLILVKVPKGRIYEPRHWFSLADFDIIDVDEADGILPYSIRISSKEHRFEVATACQREKDAWLRSIRESRSHKPNWINEPTSSLRFDGKGDLIPSALDDGPFELVNVLPTIQSIPELAGNTEYYGLADTLMMAFGSDAKQRRPFKQDSMLKQESDLLSRRSSSTSVKGIFAPLSSDSEMIVVRRYSASARSRVDQGLQDVISQLCLTARSYATLKDEELFPSPKVSRRGFVRSQSALSISGMAAKSGLTRHESVHVLRRRSLIEWPDGLSSKKSSISSGQSSTRRHSTAPCSTAMSDSDGPRSSSPHSHSAPSPSSASLPSSSHACSSPKGSVRSTSIFFSSTVRPPCPRETSYEAKSPMKPSRSLVSGVRDLLFSQSRSSSALSLGQSVDSDMDSYYGTKKRTVGSLRRWARGSIHRRTRSAPPEEEKFTLPHIQKLPALSIPSLDLPGLDFGSTIPLSECPKSYDDSPQTSERLPAGRLPLRPILVPSVQCQSPVEVDNYSPKHLSFLHRLKA
ncbi:hypothetical protein C0993_000078 [Termitomyces sp. T159_Od127]|nr:hypothetical protein C0993_000078 [Termitomyces sp. T159_Od127]